MAPYKYKGDPYLDYDRLEKVGKLLPDYPIVLHGASTVIPEFVEQCNAYGGKVLGAKGVPEDMLRKAATMAVCKINIEHRHSSCDDKCHQKSSC